MNPEFLIWWNNASLFEAILLSTIAVVSGLLCLFVLIVVVGSLFTSGDGPPPNDTDGLC